MTGSPMKKDLWTSIETNNDDGRKRIGELNRRRIIRALFELVSEGDVEPSAEKVVERAGVGMRTVYRHFQDMDGIYDEMTKELTDAVMPLIMAPYESTGWRDRLIETVDKRAELYEAVFPMKVSMSVRRFHSKYIGEQYQRNIKQNRSSLQAVLPEEITSNDELFDAIVATLDFPFWRQLRQDQNRSVERAKASVRLVLTRLIASIKVD